LRSIRVLRGTTGFGLRMEIFAAAFAGGGGGGSGEVNIFLLSIP